MFSMKNPFSFSTTATKSLRFLRPIMFLTVAVLLGCMAIHVGLVLPTQEQLAKTRETLNALRQQRLSEETAKTTQQVLSRFWQNLPTQQKFTHLGVRISTLAKQNKVTIPGMDYQIPGSKKQRASKGSITFQAFGSYTAIRRFIHQLEKTEPYLIIEKLTAEQIKKTDSVAFTLQIVTFFQPPSFHAATKEMTS